MFHPNDKVGDYTLIRFLGRGGFGEVWLGEKDAKQFALKFPKAEVKIHDIEKEVVVWLLAKGHRNVLPVEGIDFHDDRLFIISEFAPDGSLEDWLNTYGGKAPSIIAAIEKMLGILDGLEYLHKRKIIHRDIKPANVLLSNNIPRITDFGIAKFIPFDTDSHLLKGSPAYMSPEAWEGNRNEQTDLWSVSVVFYELLCGQRPFSGRGHHEIMYSICNREPQFLPEIIPTELRGFIAKALKKKPDERYLTASAMRGELQDIYQDILQRVEDTTIIVSPSPKPTPVPQPTPQPIAPSPQPNPQPQPAPKIYPQLVVKPQPKPVKRMNRAVAGIVATLLVVSAGAWGIVKFKFGNPEAPTVTTPAYNSGTSQLQETKTDVGTFVQIPAGEFLMGSENVETDENPSDQIGTRILTIERYSEHPMHPVKISSFEIGKYELTQQQWQSIMGTNPSKVKSANLPVENVSWEDAQEFIKKLNEQNDGYTYRLPTEAEWEYACRAGSTGDYAGNLDDIAWYSKNSADRTHPVGMKQANQFGLYDMHGNVCEWCSDWYTSDYYKQSPSTDPPGPSTSSFRAVRGGSYTFGSNVLRSASRSWRSPQFREGLLGFRLVRTSS